MNKLTGVMPFWTDGRNDSTRNKNVFFTWEKLKKLSKFLNESGVQNNIVLYDYSPNRVHEEAIHIPYELNRFQKSKKINQIIRDVDCHYVFFFDSDVFFDEQDYDGVLKLIKDADENQIYTFDLAKLEKEESDYIRNGGKIDKNHMDWSFAFSGPKERGPLYQLSGGLGGSFFITKDLLLQVNGFDENFETWGGEDGDALNKIFVNKLKFQFKAVREVFPFHLYHETLWQEPKYYVIAKRN
jgi:hypothetical protein